MNKNGGVWNGLGLAAAMPFLLAAAVLLGYEAGHFFDRRFLTTPILGIIGLLTGIVAGFVVIFRMASWLK